VLRIAKLDRAHDLTNFDCGVEALNIYLKRYARQNQKAEAVQTYLGFMHETVIGYYTLVAGDIEYEDAPERLRKGLARHPVPMMLLARLAVQTGMQGKGVGSGLLRDATLRTLQAADIAGVRALAVYAKDDAALAFHRRFGFEDGFEQPMHLYMLISDIRRSMGAS
jgi:GNAT superfamily N-acetyltransferase